METLATKKTMGDVINVFLIGNNPIELSNIYEKLKEIKSKTYHAEIGFDMKDVYKRIRKYKPTCILIDDNFGRPYLKNLLNRLSTSVKTKHIPVTIIKNSNYHESYSVGARDFILKDSITAESLSRSILNSLKINDMNQLISKSYRKRKSQLMSFFD